MKLIKCPQILSVAIDGWRFASETFADREKKYRRKQQWKSFFAAFIDPGFASEWFKILMSSELVLIAAHRKGFYLKPFRVYMSIKWNKKQKVKVIRDTYRFAIDKGDAFMQAIICSSGFEIARFKLSDSIDGFLCLGYDHLYRKEGELVFSFYSSEFDGMISSAAFSFEEIEGGRWLCRIGCIQGHKINDEYSAKVVQKMMNGLRPKSLIIFAVQEFVRQLGFTAIYGAGDTIQVYRKKHAIHLPWMHNIEFDYNAIWVESGGQPADEGWYELPLTMVRRGYDEMKTHKRALYRRRYSMLDDLSLKIADTVKKIAG